MKSSDSENRLGILGGTFDPVHDGHLELAGRMRDSLGLRAVRFLPAFSAPHKAKPPEADGWHRVAMLALATAGRPDFEISTLEMNSARVSYTIDSLSAMRASEPHHRELFFLMGADMFEETPSWKDFPHLLELCHFAVAARPGHRLSSEHLPPWARLKVVELQGGLETGNQRDHKIYLCPVMSNSITSTAIRERAARRDSLAGWVPQAVAEYIDKNRIYAQWDDTAPNTEAVVFETATGRADLHRR